MLVVLFALLVLAPIAFLGWSRRRGRPGLAVSDPQAHKNLGARGGASSYGSTGAGPGGDYPSS